MKVIILAAGQGSRLRPYTDDRPKCMVEVVHKSLIMRQLEILCACGIQEQEMVIVTGYRSDVLKKALGHTAIQFVYNEQYETTNMVCSLMCARRVMEEQDDIIISYGDIIYQQNVFRKVLETKDSCAVVVDDDWYGYWSKRCEDPLEDAETLLYDERDYLVEIGQKTQEISNVKSQYIGLMRFRNEGLKALLQTVDKAKQKSRTKQKLWRTDRSYEKMYMTDLLQGMIDEGEKLRAVHIHRGWYEIDDAEDLKLVERELLASDEA